MKTIWKFELKVQDVQEISMPHEAEMLTVQIQGGIPYLWCLVAPDMHKRVYIIKTIGTGHAVSDEFDSKYIGTYQLASGNFVGHVFI